MGAAQVAGAVALLMQHHSAKLLEQRKKIPAQIRNMLLNGASDLTSAELKRAGIVDTCKDNRVLNIGARLFQKWDDKGKDEDPTSERMVQECRSRGVVQGAPRRRRTQMQGSPRRRRTQ